MARAIDPHEGDRVMLFTGAMTDGGAELRERQRTPDPVRAVSIVEKYRQLALEVLPGLSDEDREAIVLRALYGHMTPGRA